MSSVFGDFAVGLGESGPRSLASFGPRGGSGQGLVGRLERALRFSECFHPLEDLEGSTVRVGGDAKGHDPTVDTNGNGWRILRLRSAWCSSAATPVSETIQRAARWVSVAESRCAADGAVPRSMSTSSMRLSEPCGKGLRVSTRWLLLRTSIREPHATKRQTSDVHADDSLGALGSAMGIALVMERCSAIGDPSRQMRVDDHHRGQWFLSTEVGAQQRVQRHKHLSPRSVPRPRRN